MNRIIKYLCATVLFFTACTDDNKEESSTLLSLLSPSDSESVDLNTATTVTFKWQPKGAEVIGGYYLVLSAAADLSNPVKITVNAPSYSFTAANLDAAIGGFNSLKSGETGSLYWTVTPVSALLDVTLPETRSLQVKRIVVPPPEIMPLAPEDFLEVDAAAYSFPLTVQWKKSSKITAYTLKISTDSRFPAGAETIAYDVDNADAISLNADQFDALLAALGFDYEQQKTLYWTVVSTDATIDHVSYVRSISARRKVGLTILLNAPAEGLSIDAELEFIDRSLLPLIFQWDKVDDVSVYVLTFSLSSDFSKPVTFETKDGRKGFGDESFDDLLEALGISYGAQAKIYWTVKPKENAPVKTQTRSLQAKRWNNTVLVGTFAGSGAQLNSNLPSGWTRPAAYAVPNQEVTHITDVSLGTLKTAMLQTPVSCACDKEGNVFVTLRQSQLSGVVKISPDNDDVSAVDIILMAGGTDNTYTDFFCPNDLTYDATRNRFLVAEETNYTFEHFHTVDFGADGKWHLNARKMSIADRKSMPVPNTKAVAYIFDASGIALHRSDIYSGKHCMVAHPQTGYIYGHFYQTFYRANPDTYEAEVFAENVNNAATGGTKSVAIDPQEPSNLWFTSYHHANNMGVNFVNINTAVYTHASAVCTANASPIVDGDLVTASKWWNSRGIIFDAKGDNMYVFSSQHHIRQVNRKTQMVTTLAGVPGSAGYVDGDPATAKFNGIISGGISAGGKIIYVADPNNHRIRKIRLAQP